MSCNPTPVEGSRPGDCEDEADNDLDGWFDCDDPDCFDATACQSPEPDPDPEVLLDACTDDKGDDDQSRGSDKQSCLVVAEVLVDPPDVLPGTDYNLTVWIPHGEVTELSLSLAGELAVADLPRVAVDGGWTASLALTAGAQLGDQEVRVHGTHPRGDLVGHALVNVTSFGPCPPGEVREAGNCVTPVDGLPLLPESLFRTAYAGTIDQIDEPCDGSSPTEVDCSDACDNDSDGLEDCDDAEDCSGDPDCAGDEGATGSRDPSNSDDDDSSGECSSSSDFEFVCDDDCDEDGDGLVDCEDLEDCGADPACDAGDDDSSDPGSTGGDCDLLDGCDSGASGDREMLHPRRVYRVGNALVACLTDSVAVIDLETMLPIDLGIDAGSQAPLPSVMERAEGQMDVYGLAFCDDLVLDEARGLAVATTRGSLGQPAGLTTWQLPDLSAPPFDPPVLLQTYEDPDGFEGAVLVGDILYAAHKPGSLSAHRLGADGTLTILSDTPLPEATGVWAVASDGQWIYVTDAGVHDRGVGAPSGGHLYVVDGSNPSSPQVVGYVATEGLGKSIAPSGDGQLALAGGDAGVEIYDVSSPSLPVQLVHEQTPGAAISLGWSDGYLLVSDWMTLRLYDAADRGALRLLWATDLALAMLDTPAPAPEWALDNSGYLHLSGLDFIASDMDTIFLGRIQPGRRAPSLNLLDRRHNVPVDDEDSQESLTLRMSNGSRMQLWVELREDPDILGTGEQVLVLPGETRQVEVTAGRNEDGALPQTLWLDSDDPMRPTRRATLVSIESGLVLGDTVPDFRLPMTNRCEGSSCSTDTECFQLYDAMWEGLPILIAFYTSW